MHIQDNLEEFPGKSFHVEAYKLGASSRDNTVDEEVDKFQDTCGISNIAKLENAVASNGDVSAIVVFFLWTDFANHFGVCDLISSDHMDVLIEN